MSPSLAAVLILHITAGGFGLASGGTALLVRKGAWLHRMAGNAFFISMLVMAASGAVLAVLRPAAPALNLVISGLTLYLVATSWATVLRREGTTGAFDVAALLAAFAIGAAGLIVGVVAAKSDSGAVDKIPAFLFFFFGGVAILAGLLDASVILRRGSSGAQRIARHLWRMCFALLIAAIAFFVGQGAKIFPEWVQQLRIGPLPVLAVPVITVLLLMLFWLARVLFTRWYKTSDA